MGPGPPPQMGTRLTQVCILRPGRSCSHWKLLGGISLVASVHAVWLYEITQLLLSSLPDPADLSLWAEPFLAWNPLRN